MDKKKLLQISLFCIIIASAIFLRVLYMNGDLWYDEACSWVTAKQAFPFGIMDNLLNVDLQHTPLYFFLLHFWIKIFGDGEFAMRSLSLIFGIASVPLAYTVAKKIIPQLQAFFLAAVVAVSPLLVLFSVEIRMYPLVVFLVLLSLNYLIDFEQKEDIKSLIKLIAVNVLIPYTLVGGILYNFSVLICYSVYLFKNKKDAFLKYIKGAGVEILALVPYFVLVSYYAKMRSVFVISHEGDLQFFHLVDVIRNFFGSSIVENIYWPSTEPYSITFLFTLLVIVPCVYFVIGFIKGFKKSDGFLKLLYQIFLLSFGLSVLFSLFRVNVFTVRYILYLLPPIVLLSLSGLFKNFSDKHCKIFLSLFLASSLIFTWYNASRFEHLKTIAFKTVKLEADRLNLTSDDVVIMPFGSDAPYYFRALSAPRVFNSDFHKEVRNPYNSHYYDKSQQKDIIIRPALIIYHSLMADKIFSRSFTDYFVSNVNATVPSGRYVLVAMYGGDANFITDIDSLRKSVPNEYEVPKRKLEIMFKKYLCDVAALLSVDFDAVDSFKQDNYTFFLYKKR